MTRVGLPESAGASTKRGSMLFASRTRLVVAVAALGLAVSGLVACGGAQSGRALSYGESARRDYERALSAFHDRDCLTATPLFQHVRREYPYSRYAALAELRSADCELEQQHYTEAIRQYQAFIRARPTHADVDYAQYRVAVGYFRQIPQDFFLSPPREERDQGSTRSALRVIDRFLRAHPDSEHVEDAERMRREVLALLAHHELYVADFYLFRDQPRATIARIETMLRDYRGSGLEPLALVLLGRTYLHLRDAEHARGAFEDVLEHYPESGFAIQARNFLEQMGASLAPDAAPRERRPPSHVDDEAGEPSDEPSRSDEEPATSSGARPGHGSSPGSASDAPLDDASEEPEPHDAAPVDGPTDGRAP